MNSLLAELRIKSFEKILKAYTQAGIELGDVIDGGAGSGAKSTMMLAELPASSVCYAFEPFPGNHRFFEGLDGRIRLIPKALAEASKTSHFRVKSTVAADSKWGKLGMEGYSSVGRLTESADTSTIDVACVRADAEIADTSRIGAVKLDLQGGELGALQGMTGFLPRVQVMWVEFSGQPGLLDFLEGAGFIVFDTEYFFLGDPTEAAMEHFTVSKQNATLSTGRTAWFGFKKNMWRNYEADFAAYKTQLSLVQTDVLCVNRAHLGNFVRAMSHLAPN